MKNLILKAGHFFRKDFDPENPTARDIDLTLWLFHQLKEFGLNPNFVCCPYTPNPAVVDTDTRLVNPHINGTDLCFDLLNVITSATTLNAVCIPIAQLNINTTMVDNGDGTYTYTNEEGVSVTFNTGGTQVPVNVLTSNTINSTSIDVSTLPNQPICTGTKTYVLLNTDGTGAAINASTGVVSINTANFYPYCGKKKLSGHILCGTNIVGHFILDIQYEEYDVYEYDLTCTFRDTQSLESIINGSSYIPVGYGINPINSVSIANLGTANLNPAVFGVDQLSSQLNDAQLYGGFKCASYSVNNTNNHLKLTIPKNSTTGVPGNLTGQLFKRYTVRAAYGVTKWAETVSNRLRYVDENLPLITSPTGMNNYFSSGVLANEKVSGALSNNVHFINGIYGTTDAGQSLNLFETKGLESMFRTSFAEFKEDGITLGTGLNGFSNRGFNEINFNDPLSPAAFESWKQNLIDHITVSANNQGITIAISVADDNTIDIPLSLTKFCILTIDVPTHISLTGLAFTSLTTIPGPPTSNFNEWIYNNAGLYPNKKIQDWKITDIGVSGHVQPAAYVSTAGIMDIAPKINNVGGSTNFEPGCIHGSTTTGV